MKLTRYFSALVLAAGLAACGGGGGNPGTSSGATPVPPIATVVNSDPLLAAGLVDGAGAATSSISASGYTVLSVKLTDPSGMAIANQVIDVSGDSAKVIFPEGGTGLTSSAGIATVKVARASLTASGAGSLTVAYSYKVGSLTKYPNGSVPPTADKVYATYVGYQLSIASVTLTNLDVGTSTLAAYGTRQVSVQANINGVAASSTPVQVNFTTTCGQVSPSSASTDSSGLAVVSYTATDVVGAIVSTLGCSGKTVEISASTVGAAAVSKTLVIAAAPATNMSFISVSPARIYLANSGGTTQAIATFQLVNAQGEAILGQDVRLTLKTLNGGIPKASFGTVGSVAPVIAITDSSGKVSVPVFSGTVPTNVLVNAALVSNPAVQTDSSTLAIASGRPVQSRLSLSLGKFAIRGFNFDGEETTVTLSMADRQGNPVPDGTAVNFVTEGGVMIPPTCTTGAVPGDSRCTVNIRSGSPRPLDGRVSILAYAAGEEDFVDANFNNVFDCGETFTDLGTAYRDDNENGAFDTGEFSVPRAPSASACTTGVTPSPSVGDRVWGAADVRRQAVMIFSTDDFNIGGVNWTQGVDSQWSGAMVTTQLSATIVDLNGNSVPSGSTIAVSVVDNSVKLPSDGDPTAPKFGSCALTGQSHTSVPNSLAGLPLSIYLKECVAGDQVKITVTTPGLVKALNFTVP